MIRFITSNHVITLLLTGILCLSCNSAEKFSGFSYDPEGSAVTSDKEIQQQYKRTIGISSDGIWLSNEFAGARMNDFYKVSDSLYRVVIKPENNPINNSPWYAFKIRSDSAQQINLQLAYQHGEHRYVSELSYDGQRWKTIKGTNYEPNKSSGTAILTLDIDEQPLWVSAQELLTQSDFRSWADSLATRPWMKLDTVGYSHDQRPIIGMYISEVSPDNSRGVLVITGRLHPPEVTGALASQQFIEELISDTKLASQFRQQFEIRAYPFANPDGVQRGHWRHNAAGVDLNRDWIAFNQPETKAIRDDLLTLKKDTLRRVYYGIDFHSTDENIFYPINRDISTFPEDFTYHWLQDLTAAFPDMNFAIEPFNTSSPITKNWIYRTFGADAVTYEVNDAADRDSIRAVARKSAQLIMQKLLNEKNER